MDLQVGQCRRILATLDNDLDWPILEDSRHCDCLQLVDVVDQSSTGPPSTHASHVRLAAHLNFKNLQ